MELGYLHIPVISRQLLCDDPPQNSNNLLLQLMGLWTGSGSADLGGPHTCVCGSVGASALT